MPTEEERIAAEAEAEEARLLHEARLALHKKVNIATQILDRAANRATESEKETIIAAITAANGVVLNEVVADINSATESLVTSYADLHERMNQVPLKDLTIWDIDCVESDLSTGACKIIHWTATNYEIVEDITYSSRQYGSCQFNSDTGAENFIPFSSVTKEKCLEWIKAELNKEEVEGDTTKVDQIERLIAEEITEKVTPTLINTTAPWDIGGNE
jgi:hypothetical protein